MRIPRRFNHPAATKYSRSVFRSKSIWVGQDVVGRGRRKLGSAGSTVILEVLLSDSPNHASPTTAIFYPANDRVVHPGAVVQNS